MNTTLLKRHTLLLTLVFVTLPLAASADIVTFTAVLEGSQEVPPVATSATGTATLVIDTDNGTLGAIPFQMEFSGLSSAQTAAHVHQAPAGSNGPVVDGLPLGSPVDTTIALTLVSYAALAADGLYVNVHTTNFPGGEIRGQLVLTGTVATGSKTWGEVKALFR